MIETAPSETGALPAGISHSSGTRPCGSGAEGTGTISTVPRAASTEASQPGVPSSCASGVTGLAPARAACWATGGGVSVVKRSTANAMAATATTVDSTVARAPEAEALPESGTCRFALRPAQPPAHRGPDLRRAPPRARCRPAGARSAAPIAPRAGRTRDPFPAAPAPDDAAPHRALPIRILPPAHRRSAVRWTAVRRLRVAGGAVHGSRHSRSCSRPRRIQLLMDPSGASIRAASSS